MTCNKPFPGTSIGLSYEINDHPIARLPFVRNAIGDEKGRCFWSVTPTDNWNADFQTGQNHADAALAYMAQDGAAAILRWAVRDMIAEGKKGWQRSGIEMGFLARFERHALLCHMLESHETRKLEGAAK